MAKDNTNKDLVLNDLKNNIPVKEIIKKYRIPRSTLYYWLKKEKKILSNDKKKSVSYLDYEKLKKERDRIKLELQIYEDLHCFADASIREKEKAISKFVNKYPIKTMCRVLQIPKGTMYNYLFRKVEVTQNQVRDEGLKKVIF